jgi:hypothetical protein
MTDGFPKPVVEFVATDDTQTIRLFSMSAMPIS